MPAHALGSGLAWERKIKLYGSPCTALVYIDAYEVYQLMRALVVECVLSIDADARLSGCHCAAGKALLVKKSLVMDFSKVPHMRVSVLQAYDLTHAGNLCFVMAHFASCLCQTGRAR